MTAFPNVGTHNLWIQVQRAREVITTPFELQVAAPAPKRPAVAIPAAGIVIDIDGSGFSPAKLDILPGKPVNLPFRRSAAGNCASSVVFPELDLRRDLPFGQTTILELPALPPGELSFPCGVGMYKGQLVVGQAAR